MHLYYHPTTVVFVDDAEAFTEGLSLSMPYDQPNLCFQHPTDALATLNREPALKPLHERCLVAREGDWTESVIHLDTRLIEEEINNIERFRRVSVIVVDYAMPELNGLEMCAGLNDKSSRKVLVTGAADYKVAVGAFNDGSIHRFIRKTRDGVVDTIAEFVRELKQEYFAAQLDVLRRALALNPPPFIYDEKLAARFDALCRRYDIAEYYLVTSPPGYLLLTRNGRMIRYVIYDEGTARAFEREAIDHNAPSDFLDAVRNLNRLPCFFERREDYGDEPYPWCEFLYDVQVVEGTRRWFTLVIEDPPMDIDFDPTRYSCAAFLSRPDANVRGR